MNKVFTNCNEEEEIYPLRTAEYVKAQRANATLKHLFRHTVVIDKGLEVEFIENTVRVCKKWLAGYP